MYLRARPRASIADPLRHAVVGAEIAEARDGRLELQLHGAGWAVALLADDDLGLAGGVKRQRARGEA